MKSGPQKKSFGIDLKNATENKEVNIKEEQSITDKDTTPSVPLVGRGEEQLKSGGEEKNSIWQRLQTIKQTLQGANENSGPSQSDEQAVQEETTQKDLAENQAEGVNENLKEIIADTTNDNSEKDGTDKG